MGLVYREQKRMTNSATFMRQNRTWLETPEDGARSDIVIASEAWRSSRTKGFDAPLRRHAAKARLKTGVFQRPSAARDDETQRRRTRYTVASSPPVRDAALTTDSASRS